MNKRIFLTSKRYVYPCFRFRNITKSRLLYRHEKKNSICAIIFFIFLISVYILTFFKSILLRSNDLNVEEIIASPVINMIDVALPSAMDDTLDKFSNSRKQPTLVYTCLGEKVFNVHQTYIWKSLEQARIVGGPSLSIVLIISKAGQTEIVQKRLKRLGVTLIIYEQLLSSASYNATLFLDFHQAFFIQGAMEPGGNLKFNQLTTERLFALHAFMKASGTSDVFHLENDNMLYSDLNNLLHRMRTCQVFLGIPRASKEYAVISFLYIRNAYAIEHFLRFIIDVFRLGPAKAVKYINVTYINEMTFTALYLERFAATPEDSKLSGIVLLPTHLIDRNCCLCNYDGNEEMIVFDARTLGQYFGADYHKPNSPFFWVKTELIDPRGHLLEWKIKNGIRMPYIRGFRIVNLHIHSKRLHRFSSQGSHQTIGKGYNISLVHE